MNNLKNVLMGVLSLGLSLGAQSQNRNCGSQEYNDFQESIYPGVKKSRDKLESEILKSKQWRATNRENGTITTIPVVVHVLYSSNATNISESQIQSQLDVLNADFRKLNSDINTVLADFQAIAHDAEIQFCLASVDPNGAATSGITRTSTSISSFPLNDNMKRASTGGVDAWDPSKYLNLWVVPGLDDNVLGFAQFPGGQAWSDGVVIADQFFGTEGTVNTNGSFNKGRTATHEVGHYLGLRHIWGDSNCGNDQVDDTPTQQESSSGCPLTSKTCDGKLDNVQNYMDYSDDDCMVMFTTGQAERMWDVLNSSRSGLKNSASTQCANDNPPTVAFKANKTKICAGESVEFVDQSTGLPTAWQWEFEGGTPSVSTDQNPVVEFSEGGVHQVSLIATNDNGAGAEVEKDDYITVIAIEEPQADNVLSCGGEVDLSATTTIPGVEIQWYADAGLTNLLGVGADYATTISQTTSFYVTANSGGQPEYTGNFAPGTGGFHAGWQGIYFTADAAFVLKTIEVNAETAGSFSLEYTPAGGVKQSTVFNVNQGMNKLNVELEVPEGEDHLLFMPTGGVLLHRDNSGVSYPYALSTIGNVTKSTAPGVELDYYYYFYNWEIQKSGCESEATEVVATYDLCVGLEDVGFGEFKVYPNPSDGLFNLLNSSGEDAVVSIYNVNGCLVETLLLKSEMTQDLVLSHGVYFVEFSTVGFVQNKRLIVR